MMTETLCWLSALLVLSITNARGSPCSNQPLNYTGDFEGTLMNLKSFLSENSTLVFSPDVSFESRLKPLAAGTPGNFTTFPRAYAGFEGESNFGNFNESSVCLASPGNGAIMDCTDEGEPSILTWTATRIDEECRVLEAMVRYVEFWTERCKELECAPTVASGIVRRLGYDEGSGVAYSSTEAIMAPAMNEATPRFFSLILVLVSSLWVLSLGVDF